MVSRRSASESDLSKASGNGHTRVSAVMMAESDSRETLERIKMGPEWSTILESWSSQSTWSCDCYMLTKTLQKRQIPRILSKQKIVRFLNKLKRQINQPPRFQQRNFSFICIQHLRKNPRNHLVHSGVWSRVCGTWKKVEKSVDPVRVFFWKRKNGGLRFSRNPYLEKGKKIQWITGQKWKEFTPSFSSNMSHLPFQRWHSRSIIGNHHSRM